MLVACTGGKGTGTPALGWARLGALQAMGSTKRFSGKCSASSTNSMNLAVYSQLVCSRLNRSALLLPSL